jgi:uncharacterized membrane protein
MKSRQEIKALAKEGVAQQRGTAILLILFISLIALGGSVLSFIPVIGSLISTAISLLICTVLAIGVCGSYIKIFNKEKTRAGEPFSSFSFNYGRKLGGTLWANLWLFLWALPAIAPGCILAVKVALDPVMTVTPNGLILLVALLTIPLMIPAIVKGYSYRMVPYILADCPNVTATEALKLSMRMTKGHRMKLFVLDLSFIGWSLLGCLTLFILLIVYVGPYMKATMAGYYTELREEAIGSGNIRAEELQ